MTIIYNHLGQARKSEHIAAVIHLENLKSTSGTNPWPVVEECLKVFASSNPTHYRSHLVYLDETKRTRANKFASAHDKKNDGYIRYIADIPEKVIMMIRTLYSPDELPMDKQFFREFAKRFPQYRVAEKL